MTIPTVTFLTTPHITFVDNQASCDIEIDAGDVNGLYLPHSTIEAFDGVEWVDGLGHQIGVHTTRCTITWPMVTAGYTKIQFWLENASGEATTSWIMSADCIYPPESDGIDWMLIGGGAAVGIGLLLILGSDII